MIAAVPISACSEPGGAVAGAAGRVVDAGVEQRRAGDQSLELLKSRPAVGAVLVERLGERRVGERVVAGVRVRVDDPLDPQAESDDEDQRQDHQRPPAVPLGSARSRSATGERRRDMGGKD